MDGDESSLTFYFWVLSDVSNYSEQKIQCSVSISMGQNIEIRVVQNQKQFLQ